MRTYRDPDAPCLLFDQRIPMRDGIELSADIYRPSEGDGPWPVILYRTPYNKQLGSSTPVVPPLATYFARHGYTFVAQDVRGRCDSDGEFEPNVNEAPDGHDTVEWCAAQSWCNGKVGMMGGSYGGYVQWAAARERPPHLTAMVSTAAAGRWMEEIPYMFGVFRPYWMWWLNFVGGRVLQNPAIPDWSAVFTHVPLRDADLVLGRTNTAWRKWLEHNTYDDYWRGASLDGYFPLIDLPVLHITGWFDGDQWGELHYWEGMKESPAADQQWLVSGPWDHAGTRIPRQALGGRDFGIDALSDIQGIHLRFFDRWLKGEENGAESDATVKIFVMGENRWREEMQWPLQSQILTPFYFHSDGIANGLGAHGSLNTLKPSGEEPADTYTYDPDDPTPSTPDLSDPIGGDSQLDNRWKLRRDDILVYTSAPLEGATEITGHPFVVLYAISDCSDTDWHVSLCDVLPNGKSEELTSGEMRAAYRAGGKAQPSAIEPGDVYEYRVELMATSNLWKKGHRIRVTVASANYPSAARNPNTNAPTGDDEVVRIAQNTILHTEQYPSHLLAPVIPRQ